MRKMLIKIMNVITSLCRKIWQWLSSVFTMSATNIAPEIKDKLMEHLNEMLYLLKTRQLIDLIQGYRNVFCLNARSNCNTIKIRHERTKKG